MMGRKYREQANFFYEFRLDDMIPKGHLLRRINVFVTSVLGDLHEQLGPFYSAIGRPSIDPELLIRMLIVGYCFGIRSERKLCEEVKLHLAYRWFCRLDLNDAIPHHSTFSENRLNRFRESDILRHIFERVVMAAMGMGLVKGEGFAVDASVMEANASRYHGKAPDELDWTEKQRQKRAVAEYLAALEAEAAIEGDALNESGGSESKRQRRYERQPPKVISPSDPQSAWTAKANKRVQFGYGLNYLIDIENAVIVDVEATPARTYDEVAATQTMLDRVEERFDLRPRRLAADTAYGTGKFLGWLVKKKKIIPHIPLDIVPRHRDDTNLQDPRSPLPITIVPSLELLELSEKKWVLAVQLPGVKRHSRHVVEARGDELAAFVERLKARCAPRGLAINQGYSILAAARPNRIFTEADLDRDCAVAGAIDEVQLHDLVLQEPQCPARAHLGGSTPHDNADYRAIRP